ncbi:MAG: CCA tRNA nucleotidyltransferase [Phycisphaerales bacterium]
MTDSIERRVATEVAAELHRAGHIAWFAGGCVRDRLLGAEPKDYDIATDAEPARVAELFPGSLRVGEAFGVMLVRRDGCSTEVATFRRDGAYGDGRRPDEVSWSSPEEDAQRRDFTINGLFENPATGEVIDHVGGQADLERGVIRAIGTAEDRIEEDRLRMLRAVRFAARLGFSLDDATGVAIRRRAAGLTSVSRERIGHEFRAMLAHPRRADAVAQLANLRLLGPVFAGFGPVPGGPGPRLRRLAPGAPFSLALAAWLLDAASVDRDSGDDVVTQPGDFAEAEARIARATDEADRRIDAWRDALVLSNAEVGAVIRAIESRAAVLAGGPPSTMKPRLSGGGAGPALALLAAEHPAAGARAAATVRRLAASGLDPAPLVTGEHLRAAGLTPGPGFGQWIAAVRVAQLDGYVRTSADALGLVLRWAAGD